MLKGRRNQPIPLLVKDFYTNKGKVEIKPSLNTIGYNQKIQPFADSYTQQLKTI